LGKALEDLYGEAAGRAAHRLARHFTEASLFEKAIRYLRWAGEQAVQVSAYQEAVGHLGRAEGMLSSGESGSHAVDRAGRADLERLLGEAYYGLGDIQRSGDHLGRAAGLLGWPLPRDERALWVEVATALLRQGLRRLFFWRSPARGGSRAETRRAAARVFKWLAEIYVVAQDNARTLHATLTSLNLAEGAGPSAELAGAYADMSAICPLLGLHFLAEPYRRLASEIAGQVGKDTVSAYVLLATSVFTVGEGRWEESRSSLDQAIALFRQLGDWNRLGIALTLRSHVDVFQARFAAFGERHRELEALAKRSGSFQHRIWALDGQAEAAIRTGNEQVLRDVIPMLESNLAQMRGQGFQAEEAIVYGLLTQSLLFLNRMAEARQAADFAAERNLRSRPTFYSQLEGYAGPLHGYLESWEKTVGQEGGREEADKRKRALHDLRGFARIFPVARPRMELLEAWSLWLSGDKKAAQRRWERAAALARSRGMPFEEARAHLQLGQHLEPDHAGRLEHLYEARRLFVEMGAEFEAEKVQMVIDGTESVPVS
jgi:tetratricopeptide (TPR) repeat protein